MFSNSKRILSAVTTLLATLLAVSSSEAQYGSRQNAIQQAQMRAAGQNRNQSVNRDSVGNSNAARIARVQGSDTRNQPAPIANQAAPITGQPTPIIGGPSNSGGYTPQHLRGDSGQQFIDDGPFVDGGSPIVSDGYYDDGGFYDDGRFYDDGGFYQDGSGGFNSAGGCENGYCGVGRNFFNGCGQCSARNGGCGPEYWQNCWFWKIPPIFSNGEFFGGATGFGSQSFNVADQTIDDANFGFYGGANMGLSMCKLTCGLFSGQIGVSSIQSDFGGDQFAASTRDQLFVTAGIFRRVDYGIQMGVVGDFLRDEWISDADLAQVRGDIGWVYPGGNTLGFRFAVGAKDDVTSGTLNGVTFNNLIADAIDNYRFYYRITASNSGNFDLFAGWSDINSGVLGLDYDMPINGVLGMQSGFTYFIPETPEGTTTSTQDAWNIFVGFSIRPQGPAWYGNYDRPLFNVANNGTFVTSRQ